MKNEIFDNDNKHITLPFGCFMFLDITADGEFEISIENYNTVIFEFRCENSIFFENNYKNELFIMNRRIQPIKMMFKRSNKNLKKDPFYSKIPNINFSPLDEEDDNKNFQKERLEQGFDSSELWNLDNTLAEFLLPRLKKFKEKTISYPMEFCNLNSEKGLRIWKRILDKMIYSFYTIAFEQVDLINNKKKENSVQNGLYLFYYYFRDLWI